MQKILIIGKNGGLGRELVALYPEATAWGHDELDVTNPEAVAEKINELRPTLVFNSTAYNNVDGAETDPQAAGAVNSKAPEHIANICANIGATLVHYSTGQVFAGDRVEGYDETDTPQPVNAYGASKLRGEQIAAQQCPQHYIIRTEWLYTHTPPNSTSKKSFVDIMLELAQSNKPIQGVNDEFGKPTYSKDLALMSKELVEQHAPYGIYHGVNEGVASRYGWAQEIFRLANVRAQLTPVPGSTFPPRAAKRPSHEILNNTKFPKLRSWQEALKDYLTNH